MFVGFDNVKFHMNFVFLPFSTSCILGNDNIKFLLHLLNNQKKKGTYTCSK